MWQLISWVAGDVHSIIFPVSGAGLQLALSHGPPNGEAQLTIHHRRSLLEHLRGQLAVDWWGHHGIAHWARVRANGLMLARDTGANRHVVELFAFFHDARRINEYDDEDHGARGGELAKRLRGRYFDATDDEMDLLAYACTHHSDGMTQADPTVLTCWDADRLDLGRVGITPNPKYLGTKAARTEASMAKANQRAEAWCDAFDERRRRRG